MGTGTWHVNSSNQNSYLMKICWKIEKTDFKTKTIFPTIQVSTGVVQWMITHQNQVNDFQKKHETMERTGILRRHSHKKTGMMREYHGGWMKLSAAKHQTILHGFAWTESKGWGDIRRTKRHKSTTGNVTVSSQDEELTTICFRLRPIIFVEQVSGSFVFYSIRTVNLQGRMGGYGTVHPTLSHSIAMMIVP